MRNNPHPARGRKQAHTTKITIKIETTHTPQGDGNRMPSQSMPSAGLKQPTPRKGTETRRTRGGSRKCRNNPHPARGRKRQRAAHCDPHVETTHTPQGDGNTGNRFAGGKSEKQPTPRKGTETPWPGTSACPPRNNPHPARGRKPLVNTCNTSFTRNNPHPARGRKTICVYIAEIVGETIHIPDRGQLTKKERETH